MGNAPSVLGMAMIGSSVSLAEFARLGSSLSVFERGSREAERLFLGLGEMGSFISVRSLCYTH
jgi:hypothetical protein